MEPNPVVPAVAARPGARPDDAATRRSALVLGSAFWGWAGPVLVMLFGGLLRFDRLSAPDAVVFDETYYVPDANSILRHGVELNHVSSPPQDPGYFNSLLVKGDPNFLLKTGELVAHPPLGKIMMAVGQWTFGLTPFGWRFSVAVIGTVSILMIARIVRRMTRSTLLGCVAGLLMAMDGLELVLSRTAILDIFVMFWVLAGFGLLVIDRDVTRARLAASAPDAGGLTGTRAETGPRLGFRWLRIAAGACLGAAVATKWNGLYFLLAFAGMAIAWDLGARKSAGFRRWLGGGLRSDAIWMPAWFGLSPIVVYALSWSGWFATGDGYDRNWAAQHGNHTPVWSVIDSWYQYNHWMLQFGLGLSSFQDYRSNPVGWMVLARPISFWWKCTPVKNCGAAGSTAQEVLAIGTPLLWWGGTLALVFCLLWWLLGLVSDIVLRGSPSVPRRDWRAGAAVLGVLAGWLPWVWFAWHDGRTEFYYYAIAYEPFMILAITVCLGLIIGPTRASGARRGVGAVAAGGYLIAVLLNFSYLYPVLTAEVIPYSAWLSRMWFTRWI
jgi:dolichyl-phosphate-mannose-protein mannosyltransferase